MRRRLLALIVGAGVVATGCSYNGVDSLPLPGGAGGGSGSYTVSAVFADAGNLVPRESCRSNDVTVGSITSISVTSDLHAKVVCRVGHSTHLPANTVATIETTSLLGEAFVELGPPSGVAPAGMLAPGTVIPDSGTHADPTVEEILGALSAILNDGDLGDLETITTQLNSALSGRESDVQALLGDLRTFTGKLNRHRDDITAALDGLDRLSGTLAKQRKTIGAALDAIPEGVAVLNAQRPALIDALHTLSQLSTIGRHVIHASQANTVADLRLLSPTLAGLAKDGKEIAKALELVPDFPFPADSLAAIKGDYAGFYATFNLSLDTLNGLLKSEGAISHTSPTKQAAGQPAARAQHPTDLLHGLLDLLGLGTGTPGQPIHRLVVALTSLARSTSQSGSAQ